MGKSRKQTAWTKLVSSIYRQNKSRKGFRLGDAMKLAKKQYKKGSRKHGGDALVGEKLEGGVGAELEGGVGADVPVPAAVPGGNRKAVGGRRSKKCKKSRKSRR
jgi:hypothetical protein